MGRTDGRKLEPTVCNCYLIPSTKKKNLMNCFRKDVWGALSQEQVPKLCSSVRTVVPTEAQLRHYRRFSNAVEEAAKDFHGETLEDWRTAVKKAYASAKEPPAKSSAKAKASGRHGRAKKATYLERRDRG